jgi:hypothetical protein
MAPVRWRQLFRRRPLVVGLLAGLGAGSLFVLSDLGVIESGGPGELAVLVTGLEAGLEVGLVAWLGAGLVAGMSRPGTGNTSPLSPLSSWRSDRVFGLVTGLVAGLVSGLSLGLVFWFVAGFTFGLGAGLVIGLVTWLVTGLVVGLVYPQTWSSSLAFAQLAASDRTPIRLLRFLEDARSRSVLRTVGPVYQFRHARLQDRLAAREPATGQSPASPGRVAGDTAALAAEAPPVTAI